MFPRFASNEPRRLSSLNLLWFPGASRPFRFPQSTHVAPLVLKMCSRHRSSISRSASGCKHSQMSSTFAFRTSRSSYRGSPEYTLLFLRIRKLRNNCQGMHVKNPIVIYDTRTVRSRNNPRGKILPHIPCKGHSDTSMLGACARGYNSFRFAEQVFEG